MNSPKKPLVVALVVAVFVSASAGAPGADLRSTAGGRAIRRTTGFESNSRPQSRSIIVPDVPRQSYGTGLPDAGDIVLEPGLELGGDCASCGQAGCASCIGSGQFWASFEFLLWWRKERSFPPLVTTSPQGTPQATAGVLGQPATSILFGNDESGSSARPGGRVTIGTWLDLCGQTAVVGRFYSLGRSTTAFAADQSDFPILARPFFNVSTNQQDANLVAFPGELTGAIDATSQSEVFGGDVLARRLLCQYPCGALDLVVGYQYGRINEDLRVRHTLTSIAAGGSIPLGTVVNSFDLFDTSNEFHGAAIGAAAHLERGNWSCEILAKVGLGNNRQIVLIDGGSDTTVPGLPTTVSPAGLLAQPSNQGVFTNDRFLAVPELTLNAAWHITPCVDVTVGYSMMYWGHVVQPGDQIDRVINTTQVPGPIVGAARPAFTIRETDYWVHGLNLGFSARF